MPEAAAEVPVGAGDIASPRRPAGVLPGFFADPNLWAGNDRFFLYPTTDGLEDWSARAFRAFSSSDLVEWQDHGEVVTLGSQVAWASDFAWAPTFAENDGKYYFYFTASDSIGVAVGETPIGPFVDLGHPLIYPDQFPGRAIDPAVFRDSDGTRYLLWGNGVANIVPLSPDMVSFDPSAVLTWTPTEFREAPWMHRRGDTYYLSWSVDDTRSVNYHVRYATGPSPLGPWTDQGVLLKSAPEQGVLATGHHSIVNVPGTDDWVIAYHRFAVPDGDGFHREVAIDRLEHRADGLIEQVVPSHEPLRI